MRSLAVLLLVAGCGTRDSYLCDYDEQCGDGGRCEVDHRCTAFDGNCATSRRYTDHSGAISGACFDDRRVPLDPCAPGQPPAPDDGDACTAAVCERDASCCASGWTTSCVQLAQVACDLRCETRIAVTAQKSGASDLWDLRWTGTQWQARQRVDLGTKLAWLAPGVGDDEPRLAGFVAGALVIEGPGTALQSLPLTGRTYADVTSADVDRDGRDTIALTSSDGADSFFEIVKLDLAGGTRELETLTTKQVDWGDYDHDGFPDAIAAAGSRVSILANRDGADHLRTLVEADNDAISSADPTPKTSTLHGARLGDLDGDDLEDFLLYGFQARVHLGGPTLISDRVAAAIDCDPPRPTGTACTNPADAAFSADIAPDATGPVVYLGMFGARTALYRATVRTANDATTVTYAALALPACGLAVPCPGIAAVVARDLDGDHVLDVVAIDADLGIHTALSSNGFVATYAAPLAPGRGFTLVQTSVSGVVMP